MSLVIAHKALGWPDAEEIFAPEGAGARRFANLASEKLGGAISQFATDIGVRVGILSASPDTSEAPIAIVCEFDRQVSANIL